MSGYQMLGAYYGNPPQRIESAPDLNPLVPNNMKLETGNAGRDGYTVVSRADPYSGERCLINPED